MLLLMQVPIREAPGAGSSSHQQLLAQSQARQESQLGSPLSSSGAARPWGGHLTNLPLDYTPARPVPAPLWPLTHHPVPSQVSGHGVLVPTFATLAWGREDSLREMCS